MRILNLLQTLVAGALVLGTISQPLRAQNSGGSTIPEVLSRMAPEPLVRVKTAEFTVPPLETMIRSSDLIVRGTITTVNTYMSTDQNDLYTDYVVTPRRILAQKVVLSSRSPGQPAPIVFRKWGGETTVNGQSVKMFDMVVRNFSVGDEVLLLLSFDSQLQKFVINHGIAAFDIKNGRVEPRITHVDIERYRGESLEMFEAELQGVPR